MSDLGIKNNKNNGCKGQLFVAVVFFIIVYLGAPVDKIIS